MDCRVAPIEVIHRPPTFDLELLGADDAGVADRVRIIEIVWLLCLECSARRSAV